MHSIWICRLKNLLTPNRPTTSFEEAPEVNRHSHLSRYHSSFNPSSNIEERENSHRAGLRINIRYTIRSNLTKPKLNNLVGNALKIHEWSSMFIATVDQRTIPDSEKISNLRTLLVSKEKSTNSRMGFSVQFYDAIGAFWKGNLESYM